MSSRFVFEAVDGLHEAEVRPDQVDLKMADVSQVKDLGDGYFLNTGSPHYVRFVDEPSAIDVAVEGRKWRHDERFAPEGTNVNFVRTASRTVVPMRTFERGVEDETWSCGTGAVASAIALSVKRGTGHLFRMQVPGGELTVSFDEPRGGAFSNVWLTGPAKLVFEGEFITG
jgi:diaminopimelate epimerase